MKIPFINYHIFILGEQRVLEIEQDEEKLEVMRSLVTTCIPEIDLLHAACHEALVGHAAYGRRKARRKVSRKARELKEILEAA